MTPAESTSHSPGNDQDGDPFLFSGIPFVDALEELESVCKKRLETCQSMADEEQCQVLEKAYRLAREHLERRRSSVPDSSVESPPESQGGQP